VEVGTQHVVDEFLLLVAVLGAAGLVLEDDVVVPAALHLEVARVEQWIASRNINFALLRFFFGVFRLFLGFGGSALLFDLLKLAHEGGGFVFIVVVADCTLAAWQMYGKQHDLLIVAALALTTAVVCVYLAVFFQHLYPPPLLSCLVFLALLCR
jgi:hypothetical protein